MVQKLKSTLSVNPAKKKSKEDELVKSDEEEDDEEEAEIPFDERIKFADNVRKLTIEQMTSLVKMMQSECPNVLDDLDSDKLQIKVDDIDRTSFDKLMDFTKSCINKDENSKDNNDKDSKMKQSEADPTENAKSNQDDNDEKMEHENQTPEKSSKQPEEESKHEEAIDTSKYGPEGKRVKTS